MKIQREGIIEFTPFYLSISNDSLFYQFHDAIAYSTSLVFIVMMNNSFGLDFWEPSCPNIFYATVC